MITGFLEIMLTKVPAWVHFTYISVTLAGLLIAGPPVVRHMADTGTCTTALSSASDFASFDAAYAQCESLGVVRRR